MSRWEVVRVDGVATMLSADRWEITPDGAIVFLAIRPAGEETVAIFSPGQWRVAFNRSPQ